MINVPYFDLSMIPSELKTSWMAEFERALSFESLINGQSVNLFEIEFARFIGVPFSVATSNGLDGLILALQSLGIKHKQEVAVPSHTFVATWLAVIHAGGIPISIDVDEYGLMKLDHLESLSTAPKFVIPVHMHGMMVDMPRLMKWAGLREIKIIEDASQVHGGLMQGVKAGAFGDLGVFSLYPTKNLGAFGDAGIITCKEKSVYEKLKRLRNYGADRDNKYKHVEFGMNARMDTVQAALLRVSLTHLDKWNETRADLAKIYVERLSGLPLKIMVKNFAESVFHHFPIVLNERDELRQFLSGYGISTEIHYPIPADKEMKELGLFNGVCSLQAAKISKSTLSLPLTQWHSENQIEYVCEKIHEFYDSASIS